MVDRVDIPLNMVGVTVTISVSTLNGKHEISASVSVQDRTRTGIRDALAAAGEEVHERYSALFETAKYRSSHE